MYAILFMLPCFRSSQNRLKESLELFRSIWNNRLVTSTRWSGDVIRRTGGKHFNAVSHNRARPYFWIQHGRGEVRARRLSGLLECSFSNRKCGRHGMIFWVLAMEILQGVLKQHLRPRAVVGYGIQIFLLQITSSDHLVPFTLWRVTWEETAWAFVDSFYALSKISQFFFHPQGKWRRLGPNWIFPLWTHALVSWSMAWNLASFQTTEAQVPCPCSMER